MKIAFRVDASRSLGTGHLMRCLTLADVLAGEGVDSVFLCRADDATSLVGDAGHDLLELPAQPSGEEVDAEQCGELLDRSLDWLVVDHYALGDAWERQMNAHTPRLAAIDDLARPHDVDLLLDQNVLPDGANPYASRLPVRARALLGPRYALLRPEFIGTPRERDGSISRVLVNFGGSDPANATTLALDALEQVGWTDRAVDVVVGRLHQHTDQLADRCSAHPSWALHVQTPRLGQLMRAADLALGAGGTSTWERCASALPALVVTIADNQLELAAATASAGACRWLGGIDDVGVDALAGALESLAGDPDALQRMGHAAGALCDGRGAGRVARALLGACLAFRAADAADEGLTLEWRNHPEVRRFSGDGSPIAHDDHHRWFGRVIADPDRALLIAQHEGRPLAVVRFDDLGTGEPEISIYVDPARHGGGWGTEVLVAAASWLQERHEIRRIRARIHADNSASQRAFGAAGFVRTATENGDEWWTLSA